MLISLLISTQSYAGIIADDYDTNRDRLQEQHQAEASKIIEAKKPIEKIRAHLREKKSYKKQQKHFKALYKQQQHEKKAALKENREKFGKTYKESIKATTCGAKILDKQYGGNTAWFTGLTILQAVKEQATNQEALKKLTIFCQKELKNFKKLKKKGKLARVKYGDFDQPKKQLLEEFFPGNPKIKNLLKNTTHSELMCTVRGGSLSGSFNWGATLGFYKLKCRTHTGRRLMLIRMHGTVNFGFGGGIASYRPGYWQDAQGIIREKEFLLPYDSNPVRGSLVYGFSMGAGTYQGNQVDLLKLHTVHSDKEKGFGVGFNDGAGFSAMFRAKDLKPDFNELFKAMGMPFRSWQPGIQPL